MSAFPLTLPRSLLSSHSHRNHPQVLTSREFKVSGSIGPVRSLNKKSPNVSDLEVGCGGTNAWSLGGMDPGTTVAICEYSWLSAVAVLSRPRLHRRLRMYPPSDSSEAPFPSLFKIIPIAQTLT